MQRKAGQDAVSASERAEERAGVAGYWESHGGDSSFMRAVLRTPTNGSHDKRPTASSESAKAVTATPLLSCWKYRTAEATLTTPEMVRDTKLSTSIARTMPGSFSFLSAQKVSKLCHIA